MATALRHTDPAHLESIIGYAAGATRRAAPGPAKRYAAAIGISRSRANRHMTGDPHSPAARLLVEVDTLARGERTTSWPLISEAIAVSIQAELSRLTIAGLRAVIRECTDAEHTAEMHENAATVRAAETPDDASAQEAAALCDIREAEISLRRAAARRVLARKLREQA